MPDRLAVIILPTVKRTDSHLGGRDAAKIILGYFLIFAGKYVKIHSNLYLLLFNNTVCHICDWFCLNKLAKITKILARCTEHKLTVRPTRPNEGDAWNRKGRERGNSCACPGFLIPPSMSAGLGMTMGLQTSASRNFHSVRQRANPLTSQLLYV